MRRTTCFQLQDKVKGKRYAKRAHHLGFSLSYNAWFNHQNERYKPPQAAAQNLFSPTQRPFFWIQTKSVGGKIYLESSTY